MKGKEINLKRAQRSKADGLNKIYNFSEAIWLDCEQRKVPGHWPVIAAVCTGLTSKLLTQSHSAVYSQYAEKS